MLLVGGGTGLDLELLPAGCEIEASDITPSMVATMQQRAAALGVQARCQQMDGQQLLDAAPLKAPAAALANKK
ncbi:class I SAM-dependent methyltransferase [Cesiribacter andamanensis]|uniref:class I SAM-dependent methyltransferase n=1 Tax=Cesiribacter andamanensis TaxID=649507 RepID=UPI00034AD068|nr:class I SAM-dependent methyltransferase [Cesiribacter andamanensis]